MNGFIAWLEKLNKGDTKVRAVLRRSLAFEPGSYVPAYPYVEPFIKEEADAWRRQAYYLIAGLWAANRREEQRVCPVSLAKACAAYQNDTGSANTERRFVNLLDADRAQLPHRLRQLIFLLKDREIDFEALLTGIINWDDELKRTQNAWAREFYRDLGESEADDQYPNNKETNE